MKEKKQSRKGTLILGSSLTGFVIVLLLLGMFFTPYDPNAMNGTEKFQGVSLKHIMGTDNFGRDIFSRVLEGAKTTFFVGIATVAIGSIVGMIIGAVTGYFGGWLDEIIMRFNDALAAFPSILIALVFISVLGGGKYNIIFALGVAFVPSFARIVRSEFIYYKNRDYVKSAKLMGVSNLRIMFVHILPNTLPVLLSSIMIGFNNAVLAEASMSYLGIGVQPPDASLGRMLSESQAYLMSAPWCSLFPGMIIVMLVLGLSCLGDALQQS